MISQVTSADHIDEFYGVDEDGPIPSDIDAVEVLPIDVELDEDTVDHL